MPDNENVTTKFKVDISDLKKNISAANAAVRQYRAELKNADAGMEKGEKTVDSLSKKIEAQSKIVEQEQAKLDALKDELKRYEETVQKGETIIADLTEKHKQAAAQYGKTSDEAKEYAKQLREAQAAQERNTKKVDELRTAIINQDTVLKNSQHQVEVYKNDLDELGKEEKEVGDEAEKTTNGGLSAFGVALGNLVANVISNLVSKLGELITQTIETGKAFEASMSKVGAISGAAGEEMDALTEKAKELGSQTKFTASEVADGFSYMAMAGWKTDDMLEGISGVLDLAAASGADLATTSDIVTDALTAFGESADQAGRLADIMAAASSNANTNVELMGETFKYVAPLAGSMGYSMEDTAVAIGLMANAGIKGTQAGTSLRTTITRMTGHTKECVEAMSDLGITMTKVNEDGEKVDKSLGEVMSDLRDAFGEIRIPAEELATGIAKIEEAQANLDAQLEAGEITQKQYEKQTGKLAGEQADLMERAYGAEGAMKAQYASMIAGKNALSGFLALVNASDEDLDKLTTAINESSGAASEMADVMQDNLEGDITKLSSAFEGLQIAIYDKFGGSLREIVQTITNDVMPLINDVVNGVDGATTRLNNHISDLLGNLIDKATEFLPKAVSFAVDLIGKLIDTLIAQAPQIIDGAGKIVEALLDGLLKQLPTLITGLSKIAAKLLEKLGELIPNIAKALLKALPKIIKALSEAIPTLVQGLKTLIIQLLKNLPDILQGVLDVLPMLVDAISTLLVELGNALPEILPVLVPSLTECIVKIIESTASLLTNNIMPLLDAAVEVAGKLAESLIGNIGLFADCVWEIIQAVGKAIYDNTPELEEKLFALIEKLIDYLPELYDKLIEAGGDLIMKIADGFASPEFRTAMLEWGDSVLETFGTIWEDIKEFWSKPFDEIGEKGGDIIEDIVERFSKGIAKIKGFFSGLWTKVKDTFGGIKEFFAGVWDSIKETFTTIGTKVGDAIGGTFKKAINAVLQTVENAINTVPDAINGAIDLLNELPGVDIGQMDHIKLPRLAKGGIIDKKTVAMVGESGREAILPLENNKAALKEIAALIADEMSVGTATQRINTQPIVNNYNFTQTNNSPKALSRWDIYRQSKTLINSLRAEGVLPSVSS